ncbi:MAG TPA: tetratricopeptide repeat protein [Lacunisphaera sp.]|nr:tetratricopeptide repeat protein [Lacunisphaera sp.]
MKMDDSPAAQQQPWKAELDAIVGARAHGQFGEILPRLRQLDARHPNVAEIAHQLAWTCDMLEREAEALPWYEKAVALGLPRNELAGALLGLGSTLRRLGQLDRSIAVLRSARLQFPENRELDAFLALSLHAADRSGEALRVAVEILCDTSEDQGIRAYQRTLRHAVSRL